MSNDLVSFTNNQLPAYLQQAQATLTNELEESVRASFAVIGVKGKVFSIKHGGENQHVLNADGYPAQYLDVVLVAANGHLNKTYYAASFDEDAVAKPDCWSEDGVHPAGANPVHSVCATCPKNQFGSRISDTGKKGKACQDNRKVVVVPSSNVTNDRFGGGMLLRIAPMGLQELKTYSAKLRSANIPYYAVITRLSFDADAAYPKLLYKPVGYLSAEDYANVIEMRGSDHTHNILASEYTEAADSDTASDDFSTMPARPSYIEPAPAPEAEKPKRATKPRTVEETPPAVVPVATGPAPAVLKVPEELSKTLAGLFG